MKFEEWLSHQDGIIEVDCGCVTTEAFYHWMRVAYEAGSADAGPQSELVSNLSRICAESYQVVGALSEALNIFNDIGVIKALDNLSAQELIHNDVLPFSVPEAASPAPVLPEKFPAEIRDLMASHSDALFNDDDAQEIWNACRSPMIQAGKSPAQSDCCQAQNSVNPAQSQGWIPVSERMPPSRHEVLVGRWWGEKPRWCCKWATYIPGHPDAQSSGWLIPGASWTPTHWMPLPAAPQEEKHG